MHKAQRRISFLWSALVVAVTMLLVVFTADLIFGFNLSTPVVQLEEGLAQQIVSPNAVLVRLGDGEILLDKAAEERIYPASMTKIMTAIVAIENIEDMEEKVTLQPGIFEALRAQSASMAGFLEGESVRAIDLLYCALLPSGAEACEGLAALVAGSSEAFVALMNAKAESIGMEDSYFSNTWGMHDRRTFTTAKDMAKLLVYALGNELFYDAVTCLRYSTAGTNLHPDGITVRSTLFAGMSDNRIECPELLGGKTGYTSEAGLCLASFAEIDGETYILVTAGAKGSAKTEPFHILDAVRAYANLAGLKDDMGL